MSAAIQQLQPQALWKHFCALNAVPRASKKEARVIAFVEQCAQSMNLSHQTDAVGNVIIRKPATPGMEHLQTVVLQSHLDMVHQKNADTTFDFDTEGIRMYIDGDWVKAQGTTLGADNGIGVAAILALLESTDIPHPALEALFTIDEETGMTGALALEAGQLTGNILLNLDTEEDHELTIGCAGGIDVSAQGSYDVVDAKHSQGMLLQIRGLQGGHSGMDIHRGRGNANKLMNRLLLQLVQEWEIEIAEVDGGGLRNAIPRESRALINIPSEHLARIEHRLNEYQNVLHDEYRVTDPNIELVFSQTPVNSQVMQPARCLQVLHAIYACPNGIYRMSPSIEGLVQSSNNVARVLIQQGSWSVQCLTRSSVNSEKLDVKEAIAAAFHLIGAELQTGGDYPGWAPRPDAPIVQIMSQLYEELFQGKAHVNACHAGLECGILGRNYPEMQMISFGPTITGAHSPDERVKISSVQKFWHYLTETLKRIPKK